MKQASKQQAKYSSQKSFVHRKKNIFLFFLTGIHPISRKASNEKKEENGNAYDRLPELCVVTVRTVKRPTEILAGT